MSLAEAAWRARNEATANEAVALYADESQHRIVRISALSNRSVPSDVLVEATRDKDLIVCAHALEVLMRKKRNDSTISALLPPLLERSREPAAWYLRAVLAETCVTARELEELSMNEGWLTHLALVNNKNCPQSVLNKLAGRTEARYDIIRKIAADRGGVPTKNDPPNDSEAP